MNRSLFIFFLFPILLNGQIRAIDSLKTIINKSGQDTNRVLALCYLAIEIGPSNPDTGIILINTALGLSRKLKFKKGEGLAESRLGVLYSYRSEYSEALNHNNKAVAICDSMINSSKPSETKFFKKIKGSVTGNIASVYMMQANYAKALEFYFKALKIAQETGNKRSEGKALGNIGTVYFYTHDYAHSLDYSFKAIEIAKEIGDKYSVGLNLGNIANVYGQQHNLSKALHYFYEALKIAEELDDRRGVGAILTNIATTYKNQGDSAVRKGDQLFGEKVKYPLALEFYFKALRIREEVGDKFGVGATHTSIALLYTNCGKFKKADEHFKIALPLLSEIGATELECELRSDLSFFYERTNRPALALVEYKKCVALRDTIFSHDNNKKIMRTQLDHEYEKKKAVADAEHSMQIESQKLIAGEKSKEQNIIIASAITGLILVMIFAGFIFRSLRTTNKQKKIIELKNEETEHQKKEIEEKQKEILDSIHYARRIQMAQIPSEKQVGKNLERLKK